MKAKTHIRVQKCGAIIAFSCALLLVSACGSKPPPEPTLRRSIGARITTLDPQRAADDSSAEVARDLGEGLTTEAASGEIEPGVAQDWSVSADGLTYTFHLRNTARWSNGERVTAEDFVAGLRRAVDPKTASPAAELLDVIGNAADIVAGKRPVESLAATASDPATLVIQLVHAAPYFSALLANPVAYPVNRPSLAQFGEQFARAGHFVSNGAYQLAAELPGGGVHLTRNPNYWDREHVQIPAVDFVPIADAGSELNRYRADALDVTSAVPPGDFQWVRETMPAELQVRPQLGLYYFAFNLSHAPFNDQPILREALSLALDREQLAAKILKAGQVPAYSFVPPGIGGYEPQAYGWATESVESRRQRALVLYKRAGYGPTHPLKFRLLYSQADTIRNVTIAAAAQWHEVLGAEVELDDMEFRAFLAKRAERGAWDMLIQGWNADYPDPGNFLELFRHGGPQNDPGLDDGEFERFLDMALAQPDPPKRLVAYADAERRLLASYSVAPIYFIVSRRLVKPYVEGAVLNPMNHNYTKYMSLKAAAAPKGAAH